jgi:O-antigen/teichoic acid export membrane protein
VGVAVRYACQSRPVLWTLTSRRQRAESRSKRYDELSKFVLALWPIISIIMVMLSSAFCSLGKPLRALSVPRLANYVRVLSARFNQAGQVAQYLMQSQNRSLS